MSERPSTYTVQSGDTLSGIAATFYGDENLYQWIADANGIADAGMIDVGQEITLPATQAEIQAAGAAFAAAAAAQAETEAHSAEAQAKAAADHAAAEAAAQQAAAEHAAAEAAAAEKAAADKAAAEVAQQAEIDKRVGDEVDAAKYRMKVELEEEALQKRIAAAELEAAAAQALKDAGPSLGL